MRNRSMATFLVAILFVGAATQAPWPLLILLLPFLTTICLTQRGLGWHRHAGRRERLPPGLAGWPLLGSLPSMGSLAHRNLAALAKSHGASRLMALSLGATPVVVSSHPDTAREILHGAAFANRPARAAARLLMFERAIGFAPGGGEYWRHLRRVAAASLFSPRRIAASAWLRRRLATGMGESVEGQMREAGEVAVRGVLQRAALESVVGSVVGVALAEGEVEQLGEMVGEGYKLIVEFNLGDYFPLGGLLDFRGVGRRCKRLSLKVKNLVGGIVQRRKQSDCCCMQDDFLSHLLCLPEEERLSDSDIIAVLWEMIFRGIDAVVVLLEWSLARLILHPDIQAKVQQEIDGVTGGGRPVEDADVAKLHYLHAVTKEVLRMHPPGPLLSWARLAVRDVHVDKYLVPAGTTAMVNMWAITHDESNWKDPLSFRPDRFLEEEVSPMGSDLRLAPFGSGRRVCPGRAFGLATVHLWLASLLQQYIWAAGKPSSAVHLGRCSARSSLGVPAAVARDEEATGLPSGPTRSSCKLSGQSHVPCIVLL